MPAEWVAAVEVVVEAMSSQCIARDTLVGIERVVDIGNGLAAENDGAFAAEGWIPAVAEW